MDFSKLSEKISLTLINYHPSLGDSRLLYSNAVYVGGYHILNEEPLPEVSILKICVFCPSKKN